MCETAYVKHVYTHLLNGHGIPVKPTCIQSLLFIGYNQLNSKHAELQQGSRALVVPRAGEGGSHRYTNGARMSYFLPSEHGVDVHTWYATKLQPVPRPAPF